MKIVEIFWELCLELELMAMLFLLKQFPKLSDIKQFENRVYALADGINALRME